MRKLIKGATVASAALIAASAHAQLPAAPSEAQMAERAAWWTGYLAKAQLVALPDGRKMHLYCEGHGAPVVVLDSGLGDGAWSWASVQDRMAKTTTVCSYDRAGYGASSPAPAQRDSQALADDLGAMLKAAHLPGPYVLVGHSIASLDVRMFALTRPKDVAGLVLVDPSHEDQIVRFAAIAPKSKALSGANAGQRACAQEPRPEPLNKLCALTAPDLPPDGKAFLAQHMGPAYYQATVGELDAFNAHDAEELRTARERLTARAKGKAPLGDRPVIILTAGSTIAPGLSPEELTAMRKDWVAMHDEMARLSSRGANRIVEGTTHYIHKDKPETVVDTVAEVVAAARTTKR